MSSNSNDESRVPEPEAEALTTAGKPEAISEIVPEMLNAELVAELPLEWAETHLMLPIRYHDKIRVLMGNPKDTAGLNHLASLLGIQPNPLLAPPDVVMQAIQQTYTASHESPHTFLSKLDKRGLSISKKATSDQVADLLQMAESSPVIQLVNLILLEAVKSGASDAVDSLNQK